MKRRIKCFIAIIIMFGLSSCAMAQRQGEDIAFSDIPGIIRTASSSVVMIKAYDESGGGFTGSGFFISRGGKIYIVSAGHLTFAEKPGEERRLSYFATWKDDKGEEFTFPVKVVFVRFKNGSEDFAVFAFDAGKLLFNPVPLEFGDSSKLLPGDWVISIGGPSAIFPFYTVGSVAHFKFRVFIVHSALISRGSSGGPLIDRNGKVVGMNVSIMKSAAIICVATTSNSMLKFLEEFDAERE